MKKLPVELAATALVGFFLFCALAVLQTGLFSFGAAEPAAVTEQREARPTADLHVPSDVTEAVQGPRVLGAQTLDLPGSLGDPVPSVGSSPASPTYIHNPQGVWDTQKASDIRACADIIRLLPVGEAAKLVSDDLSGRFPILAYQLASAAEFNEALGPDFETARGEQFLFELWLQRDLNYRAQLMARQLEDD